MQQACVAFKDTAEPTVSLHEHILATSEALNHNMVQLHSNFKAIAEQDFYWLKDPCSNQVRHTLSSRHSQSPNNAAYSSQVKHERADTRSKYDQPFCLLYLKLSRNYAKHSLLAASFPWVPTRALLIRAQIMSAGRYY